MNHVAVGQTVSLKIDSFNASVESAQIARCRYIVNCTSIESNYEQHAPTPRLVDRNVSYALVHGGVEELL